MTDICNGTVHLELLVVERSNRQTNTVDGYTATLGGAVQDRFRLYGKLHTVPNRTIPKLDLVVLDEGRHRAHFFDNAGKHRFHDLSPP